MELIDVVIQRVNTLGYRYERDYFDVKKIPSTVRPKSCFITIENAPEDDTAGMGLRSTSKIKSMTSAFTLHFVDDRKNVDIAKYIADRKTMISALLVNSGTSKITSVPLIEVTDSRHTESDAYIVFSVAIQFTEVFS